jgi:hypothetical protein
MVSAVSCIIVLHITQKEKKCQSLISEILKSKKKKKKKKKLCITSVGLCYSMPAMVAYTCNPGTLEAEVGGL